MSTLREFKAFNVQNPWLKWITEDSEPVAYRLSLDVPTHLLISRQISRFRLTTKHRIVQGDTELYPKVGLVPAFLSTLNTFTMLKLWGKYADRFFSPLAEPLPATNYNSWELDPKSSPAEYSSLNFILKNNAEDRVPDKRLQDLLPNYFLYGFWQHPRPGFACAPSIIYDERMIRTILKVSKSLYVTGKTRERRVWIGKDYFDGQEIEMWELRTGSPSVLTPLRAVMTYDIWEDVASSYEDPMLLNGVVQEFRRRSNDIRFQTLTALDENSNQLQALKSLVGLVVADKFEKTTSLARVGPLRDLTSQIREALSILAPRLNANVFAALTKESLDSAVENLYPMIVVDQDEVFFVHPAILSVLARFEASKVLEKKALLIAFARLLDIIMQENMDVILSSEEAAVLASDGVPPDLSFSLCSLASFLIGFSRILRGENALSDWFTFASKVGSLAKCPRCGKYHAFGEGKIAFCPSCGNFIPRQLVFRGL